MKLVDANVLIYAVDENAAHHEAARRWLDAALASTEPLLLPWVSLLAFVRLTTSPRVFEQPLEPHDALGIVELWLSSPAATRHEPDGQHPRRMVELLAEAGGHGGNLVNDAHLAALALQHDAEVVTFDTDFGRFSSVGWLRPA